MQLNGDRIANLQALAEASPYLETLDSPQLQLRHDLMRAKIAAFTDNNAVTTQLWRKSPTRLEAEAVREHDVIGRVVADIDDLRARHIAPAPKPV